MPRKSVLDALVPLVEERLEELDRRWGEQPEDRRRPTLPLTPDGKVNVRSFVVDVCGLRQSQEQHIYKQPALAGLINAVAHRQGVKPVGSRSLSDVVDRAVGARIVRTQGERDELARTLAEREAVIERQRLQILALDEQLRLLRESGVVLRTAPVR